MPSISHLSDRMPILLPMQGRSEGIHVSQVINDLHIRLGHHKDLSPEERNPVYLELGNIFERVQILRLQEDNPDRYASIGEIECDGIFGTPDLLDTIDYVDEEIKFTFMSSRHGPGDKKYWGYETQLKAYCHMLGTRIGRLRVCHIAGRWTKGGWSGPEYKPIEYVFEEQELLENWAMIRSHAEVLERER